MKLFLLNSLLAYICLIAQRTAAIKSSEIDTNVAQAVKFFGPNFGIKEADRLEGLTCRSNVISYDGTTTVVVESDNSVCVVKNREKVACADIAGPIQGPIFRRDSTDGYLFTIGNDAYPFDASTLTVGGPLGLSLSPNTYVTCFRLTCYFYSNTCPSPSALPKGFACRTLPDAEGGILVGQKKLTGDAIFTRTATEIFRTDTDTGITNSFTLNNAYGGFREWIFDNGYLVVRLENAVLLLDDELDLANQFDAYAQHMASASIYTGNDFTRMLAIVHSSGASSELEIFTESQTVANPSALLSVGGVESGPVVAMDSGEMIAFFGSYMSVYQARYIRVDGDVVEPSYSWQNYPVGAGSSSRRRLSGVNSDCVPCIIDQGVVQVPTENGFVWYEVCDPTHDNECVRVSRQAVSGNGDWEVVFIALCASFAVVPASIYAYKTRKYCYAQESQADDTAVYYDREKGISYDPAYETYVNQYSENRRRSSRF